jgi:hypothetical protein
VATSDSVVEVLRAPVGVKGVYVFGTIWLTLATVFAFVALSTLLTGSIFYALPLVVGGLFVGGILRSLQLRLEIDRGRKVVAIHNWVRTVVVPFESIGAFDTARVYLQTPRGWGGQVRVMAIVRRDGSKIRVGASKGELRTGPYHAALTRLGEELGVPTWLV